MIGREKLDTLLNHKNCARKLGGFILKLAAADFLSANLLVFIVLLVAFDFFNDIRE